MGKIRRGGYSSLGRGIMTPDTSMFSKRAKRCSSGIWKPQAEIEGKATKKIRKLIAELVNEGRL